MLIRLIGGPYQGNGSSAGVAIVSLGIAATLWWNARHEPNAERKLGGRLLAAFFVFFACLALTEILSHPGAG